MTVCTNNDQIIKIMNDITTLRHSNENSDEIRELKKNLRRLQRLSSFNTCKDNALKLESLMYLNRNGFWKKIANFKKTQGIKLK